MTQETLVCSRCQPVEAENAELRQALRSMSDENSSLADEIREGHETRRLLEGRIRKLKGELTQVREESPQAERVRIVLNCWVDTLGHTKADVSMTGDRAALVMKMLRRRHCGAKNVDEQTFTLCRAIKGVGLKPYKHFKRSHLPEPDHKLMTQMEHCIGKDKLVEEHVDIYRRACRAAAERREAMWTQYQRVSAIEAEWARMVTAPLVWMEQGADEADIERFLWERVTERDRLWDSIIADVPALELVA